jgi:hypothetical protein
MDNFLPEISPKPLKELQPIKATTFFNRKKTFKDKSSVQEKDIDGRRPVVAGGMTHPASANGSDYSNDMNGLNNNEAKRVRRDSKTGSNPPSRVIHIRNIPSDVTEAEVIHLGIPFGRVTNVLVLKGKNQVR